MATIIEQIKAEIERRIETLKGGEAHPEVMKRVEGVLSGYSSLLSFINTMEEQEPDAKDSESSLEYWLEHFGMPKENIEFCATQIAQGYGAYRYLEGVRHGAEAVNELGKEVARQEHPEVDLEKEIEKYFSKWVQGASDEGCFNADSQLISIYDCHRIARHFYELGKARKK